MHPSLPAYHAGASLCGLPVPPSRPVTAQALLPARLLQGVVAPSAASAFMKRLQDDTLAYAFEYPAATASGRTLPLVFSRKPERYSSAAPLTADARQRIVCELADLVDSVTVSVTVGERCIAKCCLAEPPSLPYARP